jgi:hypothetical protein
MKTVICFLSPIGKSITGLVIYDPDLVADCGLKCGEHISFNGFSEATTGNFLVESIVEAVGFVRCKTRERFSANSVVLRRLAKEAGMLSN